MEEVREKVLNHVVLFYIKDDNLTTVLNDEFVEENKTKIEDHTDEQGKHFYCY